MLLTTSHKTSIFYLHVDWSLHISDLTSHVTESGICVIRQCHRNIPSSTVVSPTEGLSQRKLASVISNLCVLRVQPSESLFTTFRVRRPGILKPNPRDSRRSIFVPVQPLLSQPQFAVK